MCCLARTGRETAKCVSRGRCQGVPTGRVARSVAVEHCSKRSHVLSHENSLQEGSGLSGLSGKPLSISALRHAALSRQAGVRLIGGRSYTPTVAALPTRHRVLDLGIEEFEDEYRLSRHGGSACRPGAVARRQFTGGPARSARDRTAEFAGVRRPPDAALLELARRARGRRTMRNTPTDLCRHGPSPAGGLRDVHR